MEKVKKLFSPGHQEDDGQMYTQHAAGKTDAGFLKPVRSNEGGTSGGVTDSSGNYGAGQNQGISSYIPEDKTTSSTTGTGSNTYRSSEPTTTAGSSSTGQGVSSLYKDPSSNTQGYSSHDPFASDYSRVTSQDPSTSRGPTTSSTYDSSSTKDPVGSNTGYGTATSTTAPTSSSSYEPTTSGTSRSAMPGAFASTPITENAPQLGTSGAPQIGRPDFGGNDSLDPTSGTSSYGTTGAPGYGTSTAPGYGTSGTTTSGSGLSSSQMVGAGAGAGTGAGLTGASLADRSVGGPSSNTGMGSGGRYDNTGFDERKMDDLGQGGGSHPTFTGNRLDPNFQESQPSYHEESLGDRTHQGEGWRKGTGLTGTSHDSHGHDHHHHGTTGNTGMTSSRDPYPSTSGMTATQDPYSLGQSGTASSRDPYTSTTEPSSHNYGRDAALGGGAAGAGAAGYGLMSKGQGDPVDTTATGPASKTVGPHSSNLANVMDPRVKPEPAKMHEHTTTGPHQSDTFNKLDPRVKDTDPSRQAGMQGASYGGDSSYGRDAALVGAGGVAGAAAYSAYDSGRQDPGTATSTYDRTQAPTGSTMTQERGAPAPTVPRESTTGTSTRHEPTSTHGQHGHHDPYTKEHHADREAENREQTKGGMFGFLHKKQDPKYQDKEEPDTTARDKYYGTDHVTHPKDSTYDDRTRSGPGAGTATAVGAGAVGATGAGANAASHSSRFDHHDPTGPGLTHGTSSRDYDSGYNRNPLKSSSHEAFYNDSTGPGTTHGSGHRSTGAGMLPPGATTASAQPSDRRESAAMGGAGGHHGETSSHDYGTGKSSTGTGHSQDTSSKSYEDGRQSFDEQGRPKEKRSLMDRVLHREHPNKLHKEPPS